MHDKQVKHKLDVDRRPLTLSDAVSLSALCLAVAVHLQKDV